MARGDLHGLPAQLFAPGVLDVGGAPVLGDNRFSVVDRSTSIGAWEPGKRGPIFLWGDLLFEARHELADEVDVAPEVAKLFISLLGA